MAILKFSAVFLLALTSCATANGNAEVKIHNYLNSCVEIKDSTIINERPFPELRLTLLHVSSTAKCGCKSKINRFKSEAKYDDFSSRLLEGDFSFPIGQELILPLALQSEMIKSAKSVEVSISCAPPE